MASDLFPIRRSTDTPTPKASDGDLLLRGNPLSDALLRAFRQTFGLASNDVASQQAIEVNNTPNGTIVPSSGETNP